MSQLQHFGWFFGRGFGPQGWGRPDYRWNYAWQRPDIYQQSVRELEQAGLVQPACYRPSLLLSRRLTLGGTKADTSPPSEAASLTMLELT